MTEKIGKYEIIRPLGKGATAVVYLARDPALNRQVAIKLIRFGEDSAAMSRRLRKIFQTEDSIGRRPTPTSAAGCARCSTTSSSSPTTATRSFDSVEFPDTLLYAEKQGDALVTPNGQTTASWMKCPGTQPAALVMAGAETDTMMPVGVEGHVADRANRAGIYGGDQPSHYEAVKAKNAVMLIAHPGVDSRPAGDAADRRVRDVQPAREQPGERRAARRARAADRPERVRRACPTPTSSSPRT